MTVSVSPKGPLKRYRELWRSDDAKAFLAVYRTHWVPDMGGVPVYREEPVTVSDLMTMGDTGEHHYELYGIDLNELTASLVAESREDRVRIPQDDGTWRWEKESDLALEPEAELLPEPVPEPEPVERVPLPRSASEAILGTPNPPGDTPIGLRVDPQYRRPAEPRSDTPRERAP